MEFKIGDKVKVINQGKIYSTYKRWIEKYGKKYIDNWKKADDYLDKDKKYEIVAKGPHDYGWMLYLIQDEETRQVYIFSEDGLKKIGEKNMNKDLVLRLGDRIEYINNNGKKDIFYVNNFDGDTIRYFEKYGNKTLKVDRPVEYETIYEPKEILDDKEKEYLSYVIRPFRDRVKYIKKMLGNDFFIKINLTNYEEIDFPYLKKDTMYKGMEIDKEYTLEELGL